MTEPRILPAVRSVVPCASAPAKTPEYRSPFLSRTRVILMLTLTSNQKALLSVTFLDSKGNPAPVDSTPVWMTDNTDLLALTPAADGLSCTVAAVGPLGSATAQVNADADLGAGVVNIFGTLLVEVTAGQAATVAIAAGTPEEQ